ncbi:MAG: 2-dehydro-3-deoxygalactonokinase [Devosia sp.]
MTNNTDWVAVDWGTSNVRAWGIAADGSQTFATGSDKGMSKIARADYPTVLDELIGAQIAGEIEIVICGMAGARQGWREAPYLDTPADLNQLKQGAVRPEGAGVRFSINILPGVCQRQTGHEDVMRGEETQLLGLLHLRPGFSGTAILPGTHSKWAEIRDRRIVRFSSAMTGELYEVLSQHSVLRHSFAGETNGPATEDGIAEGLAAGLAHPELLTALAFRTRAAALLSGKGADWCSGYLSGLLVGTEIGGHRDWLDGQAVPLIGSARFGRLYGAALKQIGVESFALDAAEATIAGLKEARAQ